LTRGARLAASQGKVTLITSAAAGDIDTVRAVFSPLGRDRRRHDVDPDEGNRGRNSP
jgi:hypothetical protein